jgi:hypothetical protein
MRTTIEVSPDARMIWRRWCKHYGKTSPQMMDELMRRVRLKQQEIFYNSLPPPVKIAKPLQGKRLRKKYTKK